MVWALSTSIDTLRPPDCACAGEKNSRRIAINSSGEKVFMHQYYEKNVIAHAALMGKIRCWSLHFY